MNTSSKRLRKELQVKEVDDMIVLGANKENIRDWRAVIKGPPSSPFEGHEFLLRLDVGAEYPLTPPSIRFMTKCFHPNINFQTGEICLDILKKEWSPAWSLQSACRAVQSLLADPNSESPLNCDAGNMIRAGDLRAYNSTANMYCKELASAKYFDVFSVDSAPFFP